MFICSPSICIHIDEETYRYIHIHEKEARSILKDSETSASPKGIAEELP